MKKILTFAAIAGFGISVYAQGMVSLQDNSYFITTNSTVDYTGVSTGSGSTGHIASGATSPNAYYFALLSIQNPSGTTTLPTLGSYSDLLTGWSDTGVTGANASGILAGKIAGENGTGGAAASNWAAGTTNFFVVVGWSADEGADWATVASELGSGAWNSLSGFFGFSSVGYGVSTASPSPAFPVFGTSPGQIQGFTLYAVPVPEPATMALAGLGGLSLLLFRRRKS